MWCSYKLQKKFKIGRAKIIYFNRRRYIWCVSYFEFMKLQYRSIVTFGFDAAHNLIYATGVFSGGIDW